MVCLHRPHLPRHRTCGARQQQHPQLGSCQRLLHRLYRKSCQLKDPKTTLVVRTGSAPVFPQHPCGRVHETWPRKMHLATIPGSSDESLCHLPRPRVFRFPLPRMPEDSLSRKGTCPCAGCPQGRYRPNLPHFPMIAVVELCDSRECKVGVLLDSTVK